MADPVLLVGLALASGAALALAPLPAAVAAALCWLALRWRASRWSLAAVLLALVFSGLRARAALDEAAAHYAWTASLLSPPARCEVRGVVIAPPVLVGEWHRSADEPPSARIDVALSGGSCGDRPLTELLRVRLYGAPLELSRGDQVSLVVDLAPVHLFRNEELRDALAGIARTRITASGSVVALEVDERGDGVGARIDRARAAVRARILATYHPDAAALGRALVLGETDLDPDDETAFRDSGLAHLLAVSGTHLVLAVAGLAAVLRAVLVRIESLAARVDIGRLTATLCIPAAWLYADFAGGGGSAIRAAAMLSCAMLARTLALRPAPVRCLAWSLVGGGLADPLVACDLSFSLSAAATAGLIALNRPLSAFLVRGPWLLRKLLSAVSTTLAAMLGCTPLLLLQGGSFPLLGIAANVVAAPVGELAALPFCLAHAVLPWAPDVERGTAWVGSGALLVVRAVARATARVDMVLPALDPSPAQMAVLVVVIVSTWAVHARWKRWLTLVLGVAGWLLLEILAVQGGAPRARLRVTMLDIGQGDAILVDLPEGGTLLVDGGGFIGSPVDPGARVIRPVLRARRRDRVDVVVLSHPHPDHFGGLPAALSGVQVGELWDTGQGESEGAGPVYAALLEQLRGRGVVVHRPDSLCGPPKHLFGATVEVLAPCPGVDTARSANDNSFVLRIQYGARAVLLVGDTEHEAEDVLIQRHGAGLRADLLKVGHHGSRSSTRAPFLDAVRPSLAAISCGVRNRFGHPHPETRAALAAAGVEVVRTDRGGAIVWETDGSTVWVRRPGALSARHPPRDAR
ncbi:DNA internalization-related competence protein ComEC/Rec2 [Chondromyces crocatus]|uniref:Competence protein n=1 Tax=Chondromyces crocatus TaxID=52 RepID=A0A0K1E5X3_CHOCO|nr:DNA internalization-related competence protein ComEC/Rec2 [Chondromyces crocatus]AKT36281.1 competence protein [Chondromyces crocatus]